ncbi:P-loop containing nucleoside triphosphate hydrolase protein [Ceraceosorus guamensis]|uniref:Elongation factor 3 n=1 Tax=Ceraceosorus guamensis TaxID=1522189 RepID=A0A316VYJ2_9BASI|nr:P-loop containing nucleoside triphosphate hydrolase protein [Ceraceosorus guamensis]PWN41978.1 P-loop containing nucleoside triphosphate hydrolase protein [Ceraceosorus guamensis]
MAPAQPEAAGVPATVAADAKGLKDSAAAQAAASENAAIEKKAAKIEADRLLSSGEEEAAQELVNLVKIEGPHAFTVLGIEKVVLKGLGDKKNAAAREGAAVLVKKLSDQGVGHELEPFVFAHLLTPLVEALGDKEKPVREAVLASLTSFVKSMSPWSVPQLLKVILEQARTAGKWQVKTGCVSLLETLVKAAPERMASAMPEIIPVMSEVIWDTKTDVQKASRAALKKLCALISNKDIERFIPALINSLIHPVEEVPKTIQLLGATTFVSEVDSPTLALMGPLLQRGLNERPTATKRKCAVIIDNMSKLVDNERTVRPFLPKLLPGLIKVESAMADPEARSVVQRAIKTLRDIGQLPADADGTNLKPLEDVDIQKTLQLVQKALGQQTLNGPELLTHHVAQLATNLANARNFEESEWETTLGPYVTLFKNADQEKSKAVVRELLLALARSTSEDAEVFEDEEEGEDLCNCQFSLAYGAKILLNTATLRLKRAHRYGLCGRNGSGKSTLMRAIQNGQVEGFPSPEEVRTWYVEHDLDGSEGDISILDFIVADKRLETNHEDASKTLLEMGFDEGRQKGPIAALSGGWKMKLALARAVLFKADILLLDEPTNHLDVINVKWITDYLKNTDATSIIVSHDSQFLNNVCTDILHLNRFKIKRYPGTLTDFVKRVPEAKAYLELGGGDDNLSFKLPDPPLLDGVKTKEKSLVKMRNVHFQYPNTPAPQLNGISMQLSLSSRVAILGPNGSGKSTLVKLIVGDTEPNSGEAWKHPNLVIGYVAQHAFHHIDQHLDKTPLDYMLWRYQTGEDLEEHMKATRQLTEEEQQAMKNGEVYVHEGVKRIIEDIVGRKKLKNSFQYEVSFKAMSSADNVWLPRDELLKRGFEKKVLAVDSREAQRAGMNRPLVRREIEKHFADFGLDAEFVSHSGMRGLSGGQKVKVVLAAATWRQPHIIVLDEPTNFLDRESLAALIKALENYEGGVAIITHSEEFSRGVCKEIWAMRDGTLHASGHNWVEGQGSGERIDKKKKDEEEDKFDAMGNKIIEEKKAKKLSSAEARKAKKERMARRKRGETVESEDEL